jgi:hypothetical protein
MVRPAIVPLNQWENKSAGNQPALLDNYANLLATGP